MKELDPGYTVEVDSIDKNTWNDLLAQFDDSSFYQTWSYGAIHWGGKQLSHLVLKKDGGIVSLAQARVVGFPLFRIGIAYINWGPMWKIRKENVNTLHLRNMIRGLYAEYAIRRGYLLRILPKIIESKENSIIRSIFEEENYSWSPDPVETVIIDLSPSLEQLRQNLHRSWRRSLKDAEEHKLNFMEGSDDIVCAMLLEVAKEMKDRKGYFGSDQEELIAVHRDLPDTLKLKISVCLLESEPIAALGWARVGSVGIPLVAGTGDKALKLRASFLLWWKMVKYYKESGFHSLDTAAVKLDRNPGGYFFKTGLAGKSFKEPDHFIGQFDACRNPLSQILFKRIYSLRDSYRDMRRNMANRRRKGEANRAVNNSEQG